MIRVMQQKVPIERESDEEGENAVPREGRQGQVGQPPSHPQTGHREARTLVVTLARALIEASMPTTTGSDPVRCSPLEHLIACPRRRTKRMIGFPHRCEYVYFFKTMPLWYWPHWHWHCSAGHCSHAKHTIAGIMIPLLVLGFWDEKHRDNIIMRQRHAIPPRFSGHYQDLV